MFYFSSHWHFLNVIVPGTQGHGGMMARWWRGGSGAYFPAPLDPTQSGKQLNAPNGNLRVEFQVVSAQRRRRSRGVNLKIHTSEELQRRRWCDALAVVLVVFMVFPRSLSWLFIIQPQSFSLLLWIKMIDHRYSIHNFSAIKVQSVKFMGFYWQNR